LAIKTPAKAENVTENTACAN